jgi:predicted RNA-binding protein with PUA-like domain
MNYWLIKSEPDDFSLQDLQKKGVEPWTGVRNYLARNYMRDQMNIGDLVLFYHSNTTIPSIVGLARVGSAPYADPTQFDEKSDYFDPKSSPDAPRWQLVDMHFVEEFTKPLSLSEIKAHPGLQNLIAAKPGNRLSITPVAPEDFALICQLCASQRA